MDLYERNINFHIIHSCYIILNLCIAQGLHASPTKQETLTEVLFPKTRTVRRQLIRGLVIKKIN